MSLKKMELTKIKDLIRSCSESKEDDCLNELSSLLERSTHKEEIVLISEFLMERGNDRSYQVLITMLRNEQIIELGLRPILLYALEAYDCTSDFREIVNIIFEGTYHEAWYAQDIISEMEGPFSKKDLSYSLKRVNEIITTSEKDDLLRKLRLWLEVQLNGT